MMEMVSPDGICDWCYEPTEDRCPACGYYIHSTGDCMKKHIEEEGLWK